MNKRSLGLVGVLMIACLIVSWFVFRQANQFIGTNAFNALPNASPVILRIGNTLGFSGKLNDSELWKSFVKLPVGKQIDSKVKIVDSLLVNNQTARSLFKGRPLFLSLNKVGKDEMSIQGTFGFESITELKMVKDILRTAIKHSHLSLEKKRYDGYPVWTILSPDKKPIVYLSFNHGVFIFSDHDIFIEQMIRQLIQKDLSNENIFKTLTLKSKQPRDVKIFLNHKKTNDLILMAFCGRFKKGISKTKHFAKVSELGVRIENHAIILDGISMEEATKRDLMSVLEGQKPMRSLMIRELPSSVSYASTVRLSSKDVFQSNYKRFLIKNHQYDKLHMRQMSVKKKYGFEPFEIFYHVLGRELGIIYTQSNRLDEQQNRFFWLDINNVSDSRKYMLGVAKKVEQIVGKDRFNADPLNYSLVNGKRLKVYRSPDRQFCGHVLGHLFGSVETKYYCFYKSFMLFASSPQALVNLVNQFNNSKKLVDTDLYQHYGATVNHYTSFSMFMRPRKFIPFWKDNIHRDTYKWLEVEDKTLMKFTAMGWSMYYDEGTLHHEGRLTFDPEFCDEPSKVWTVKLDAPYNGKIFTVEDHSIDSEYRILVQDEDNGFYMFSKDGVLLWKIPLDGPILGKVKMVDYYRNKKVQYLFNTSRSIYLLDKNGNNVDHYPVKLTNEAVTGLSLFSYDNGLQKRVFVPVQNKEIEVYSLTGDRIQGWSTQPLISNIVGPIQHFEVGKKDYIVYSDNEKTYMVDRRGRVRNDAIFYFKRSQQNPFFLEEDLPNLSSHIVTSSSDGMVYRLFFDGSLRHVEMVHMSNLHKFIPEDIDLDGKSEYIYVDHNKMSIYDKNGSLEHQKRLTLSKLNVVKVVHVSPNNLKLGILGDENREIHWLDEDGSEMSGFPLYGRYNFVTGRCGTDYNKLDLISGDENCNIFKYEVN
ncbi:hypothetical protein K5X82_13095 [Halosquirtibacter xylanolyticus]|uniref:hypothetical protein n=1 Tax=Halosquirtibacter xylanolyticus TaxID=3374599 RepID=UPI003747F209|nr:hypothetical protein K5X82_13095 [Prolixibacteraceae bacterium]